MITKGQNGIGRRQFLKSTTCALATAAVGPRLLAALAPEPKSIVAGFAPLSVEKAAGDAFEFNVSNASRLPGSDGAFIRTGARIRVAGVSGVDAKNRLSREFVTHFSVSDGAERVVLPFTAWRCVRVADCNSPVSFTVPVDEEQAIRFSVLGSDSSAGAERAMPVELTLLSGGSSAKLNRGYYVIVPLYEGQAMPDWSAYSLRRANGRWALYELSLGGESRPVAFEHFVVRVDYARPIE